MFSGPRGTGLERCHTYLQRRKLIKMDLRGLPAVYVPCWSSKFSEEIDDDLPCREWCPDLRTLWRVYSVNLCVTDGDWVEWTLLSGEERARGSSLRSEILNERDLCNDLQCTGTSAWITFPIYMHDRVRDWTWKFHSESIKLRQRTIPNLINNVSTFWAVDMTRGRIIKITEIRV